MSSVLARRQLRQQMLTVLQALTGYTIESPGIRATSPGEMPYISLRCGPERKQSKARAMPSFDTTVTLMLSARISASTEEVAQDAIEALGEQLEEAVLAAPAVVQLLQQIAAVTSHTEISADGEAINAELQMAIDCEVFEDFDPTVINPGAYPALQQLNVHLDTIRPYDANGVYASPPFPGAVTPAPRTAGPDGRDEGALQIDLST